MGRYLVQTQMQTVEAPNSARLATMVLEGQLGPDDLIKDLPDGAWISARLHPELGRLFRSDDTEQTQVVGRSPVKASAQSVAAAPAGGFWVRTRQSTVHVRDEEMLGRLCRMGVLQLGDGISTERDGPYDALGDHVAFRAFFPADLGADAASDGSPMAASAPPALDAPPAAPMPPAAPPPPKGPPPLPKVSAAKVPPVPPASAAALSQEEEVSAAVLASLSVRQRQTQPEMPVFSRAQSGQMRAMRVQRAAAEQAEAGEAAGKPVGVKPVGVKPVGVKPVGVVKAAGGSGEPRGEVGAQGVPPPLKTFVGPPPGMLGEDGTESSADTMALVLSDDDLGSLDAVIGGRDDAQGGLRGGERACVPSWDSFRQAMNAAARKLREEQEPSELTWDLFRAMMERSRPSGGPGEKTWNHFRARIEEKQVVAAHPDESTWDKFRSLMTDEANERTWDRFVHTIRGRHAHRAGDAPQRVPARPALRWPVAARPAKAGPAIVGEARIKSVVVRRSDVMRPPAIVIRGLSSGPASASGAKLTAPKAPTAPPPPPTRPPVISE